MKFLKDLFGKNPTTESQVSRRGKRETIIFSAIFLGNGMLGDVPDALITDYEDGVKSTRITNLDTLIPSNPTVGQRVTVTRHYPSREELKTAAVQRTAASAAKNPEFLFQQWTRAWKYDLVHQVNALVESGVNKDAAIIQVATENQASKW